MNLAGLIPSAVFLFAGSQTVLGISGTSFMLDETPAFLLGISYYGALGIVNPKQVEQDLDAFSDRGFNWVRVWATWDFDNCDVSAVAPDGAARRPYMKRLRRLCATAGKRNMVVDVTVTRGKTPHFPATFEEHRAVVTTLARQLKPFRNVYFDVGNERDVGDARHVPMKEVGALVDALKEIDPHRLCTASSGGDIPAGKMADYVATGHVDFLCPHGPRNPETPGAKEERTRAYLESMKSLPRPIPVHFQEPFRRDYGDWQPMAADFATDLAGARAGGAAGWCFHNGASRRGDGDRPRRSFDMRPPEGPLLGQLDAEERAFLSVADRKEATCSDEIRSRSGHRANRARE